jgi:hypothetical protein
MKNGKETGVPIYASEILHLGKFNINEVDKAIRGHNEEKLSDRLESVASEFFGDHVTFKPSSLHKHLQASGFSPLGKKALFSENTRYLDQETKAVVSLEDIQDSKLKTTRRSRTRKRPPLKIRHPALLPIPTTWRRTIGKRFWRP